MRVRSEDGKPVFATHVISVTQYESIDNDSIKFRLEDGNQIVCYSAEEYAHFDEYFTGKGISFTVEKLTNNIVVPYPDYKYSSRSEIIDHLQNGIVPEGLQLHLERKQNIENISLLSVATEVDLESTKREVDAKNKISVGEITSTNFSQLSQDEQDTVKLVLFKEYSPAPLDQAKALSAVEFALVSLAKILNKSIDRTKLTQSELDFFDALVGTFNLNDMPIDDTTDWRYQYLHKQFESTQANRQEYFNKKLNVIGKV
ncbi:hypothetical protein [Paenibacillus cremeus]|nr:hypothetical protein [Paenibacillus cremeus]